MFFRQVQSTSGVHILAYILSSLKILSYDDFKRSDSSIVSSKLNEDLRFWEGRKRLQITTEVVGNPMKVYTSLETEVWENSQEFLKDFGFVCFMDRSLKQRLLYDYLHLSSYEIGDRIPLNSKAVGLFLLKTRKAQ